jgi:hypothetical protein
MQFIYAGMIVQFILFINEFVVILRWAFAISARKESRLCAFACLSFSV